jgi:hypothetical protein
MHMAVDFTQLDLLVWYTIRGFNGRRGNCCLPVTRREPVARAFRSLLPTSRRRTMSLPQDPRLARLYGGDAFGTRPGSARRGLPSGEEQALEISAGLAAESTAPAVLEALSHRIAEGRLEPDSTRQLLDFIRTTRGEAADYLLGCGDDALFEAGECLLRSSEWARRILDWLGGGTRIDQTEAANLARQMAELEAEAHDALVRWRGSR